MNSYNKRARVARTVLALILAAFFVVGGTANMLASEATRADYLRWGYPAWFHYVTAALELTAAVLIAFPRTRLAGSVLAALIMLSAAATLVVNAEYTNAIAPLIVLVLVAINRRLTVSPKA